MGQPRSGSATEILLRIGRAALTLFVLVTALFFLLRLAGDPARILLAPGAPPEMVEQYGRSLGLRRPVLEQYGLYMLNLAHGDFGISYTGLKPAAEVVIERLPATLLLAGAGMAITLLLGIPVGAMSAVYHGRVGDRVAVALATIAHCLPSFFLGVLLMIMFSVTLKLLPSSGYGTLRHLILPAITLGISNAAILARFTRTTMLDVLKQPYITAARSRGVGGMRLIASHALPNTAIALITILGLLIGSTIIGAIVTETVFAWPGVGSLLISAVTTRDLPVVQTIVILSTATMVIANLIVDLMYGVLDPRIRNSNG